jgi:hypothetical protein
LEKFQLNTKKQKCFGHYLIEITKIGLSAGLGILLGIFISVKINPYHRRPMPVIYFNSINDETSERFQKILETEAPGDSVERYQSIHELSLRLCRINRRQSVAVILISTMLEYYHLLSIKKFLNDLRIVLVLPDRSIDAISAGYKLHPRFISYPDSDFNEVGIVVGKMIKMTEQESIIAEMRSLCAE